MSILDGLLMPQGASDALSTMSYGRVVATWCVGLGLGGAMRPGSLLTGIAAALPVNGV